MESWFYEANKRKIKILKEYLYLLNKKSLTPKQASMKIQEKYNICRRSIYYYIKQFKNTPL